MTQHLNYNVFCAQGNDCGAKQLLDEKMVYKEDLVDPVEEGGEMEEGKESRKKLKNAF